MTTAYCTISEFQAYANMPSISADEQATIEKAIDAASRTIDRIANRRFYMDTTATARLYRTTDFYTLAVDDIGSLTGIQVAFDSTGNGNYNDVQTYDVDYILDPVSAPQLQRPYTRITMVGPTTFPLPISRRPQVQVTAKYGWYEGTPPDDVVEACLILSADYVKRASSVGGVLGLSELGAIRMSPLGRDIAAIVRAYRREVLA